MCVCVWVRKRDKVYSVNLVCPSSGHLDKGSEANPTGHKASFKIRHSRSRSHVCVCCLSQHISDTDQTSSDSSPKTFHVEPGQGKNVREAAKAVRISITAMSHPSDGRFNDFCSSRYPRATPSAAAPLRRRGGGSREPGEGVTRAARSD